MTLMHFGDHRKLTEDFITSATANLPCCNIEEFRLR